MTKEEEILGRHILDLSDQAWKKDIPLFTDFLNLHEQNIFHMLESRLTYIHCRLFGGYDQAERQMLGFLPDAFSFDEETEKQLFPLAAVSFRPVNPRFSDHLTHSDFLGAMMNLGIERQVTGDILVKENEAIAICRRDMAQLLIDELTRVKHTTVNGSLAELTDLHQSIQLKEISCTVASLRLDALLATAFHQPRAVLSEKIEAKEVFVDGMLVTKPSYTPKENAMISARGFGRFRFVSTSGSTRKGRIVVHLEVYPR